jgi:hypothetical protein
VKREDLVAVAKRLLAFAKSGSTALGRDPAEVLEPL